MTNLQERKNLLLKLINYENDLIPTIEALNAYDWDCDEELVLLTRANIAKVIQLFLDSKISREDLIQWANAVEMREGIEYESAYEKLIADSLFELGTPEINSPLKREYLVTMVANLFLR